MRKLSYWEEVTCSSFIRLVRWKTRILNQACQAPSLSYWPLLTFNLINVSFQLQARLLLTVAEQNPEPWWGREQLFPLSLQCSGPDRGCKQFFHEHERQSRTQRQELFRCCRSHNFDVVLLPVSISSSSFQQSLNITPFMLKVIFTHRCWFFINFGDVSPHSTYISRN